jgi:hypothetical protein
VSLLLDLSGKLTFGALGLWAGLRGLAWVAEALGPKAPKFFPVSAQRLGFAQSLGTRSVILSEADYHARERERSFLQKLAKTWWPLVAWGALTQFVMVFGAKGLAFELEIPFALGLAMSCSALMSLGFFRRRMLRDHVRAADLAEGKALDWDAVEFMGGMRLSARFEDAPRKVRLERSERDILAKDGGERFHFRGVVASPQSAHRHGKGAIVAEFRMLGAPDERMERSNWASKIKLADALQAALSAYVVANDLKAPSVALLEYPGAVVMVTPLAEHVEFLEAVSDRLQKRRKISGIGARDVALAAAQEFPSRFDEMRVAELMARHEWVDKERMGV